MKTVRSVLIVDDSEPDREYCKIIFEEAGGFGTLLEAETGEEALALFESYESSRQKYPDSFPPVLVLLDINMPGMDGFEFLAKYEALGPELEEKGAPPEVVVMLSSSNNPQEKARSQEFSSVKDFLTKPLTSEMAEKIRDSFGQN